MRKLSAGIAVIDNPGFCLDSSPAFVSESTQEFTLFSKSENHVCLGEKILNKVQYCLHNNVSDIKTDTLILSF